MSTNKKQEYFSLKDYLTNGYVLVAGREHNLRKTTKGMLRLFGAEHVVSLADGETVLEVLKDNNHHLLNGINEYRKKCLIILMDWDLPKAPGIQVAQEIRSDENLIDIPILMLTTETNREQIVRACAEIGVNGFILKPFTPKDIESKMHYIIKLKLQPPEHIKLMTVGEILMKKGRFADSLVLFDKALSISTQNTARINVLRGEALKQMGEYGEARNSFIRAQIANPDYLQAYVASADLSMKEGKKEEALLHLNRASEISPCNAERHTTIGKIYLEMGDGEEAQKAFNKGIEHDPKQAKEIAEEYLRNGNAQQAEEYFRRSMNKNSKNLNKEEIMEYVHTTNRLGIALRRQGKFKEAIEEFQKAIRLAPDDEVIHYNMGKAYLTLGQKEQTTDCFTQAKNYFRKALELDPGFEEAKEELVKLEAS